MAHGDKKLLLDAYVQGISMTGFLITKWEAIKWFIWFLRNPEYKMITFTKPKENKEQCHTIEE